MSSLTVLSSNYLLAMFFVSIFAFGCFAMLCCVALKADRSEASLLNENRIHGVM